MALETIQSWCARRVITVLVALGIFLGGLAYWHQGFEQAWEHDADKDMKERRAEFGYFADRAYPHRKVAEASGVTGVTLHTVYPPYAFPLFGVFFWPKTHEAARVLFQSLSLAAVLVSMLWSVRMLGSAGREEQGLGAACAFALSGYCSAIGLGQFSAICTGFLVLQWMFLRRGWACAAGVCWAFAMLKPQIGFAFALMFPALAQTRGLVAGGAVLALLSALTMGWTGVGPQDLWVSGISSHSLEFVAEQRYGAGLWIQSLGIRPQVASMAVVVFFCILGVVLRWMARHRRFRPEDVAAFAAVLGYGLLHHVHYDNMMLLPLVVVVVAGILKRGDGWLPVLALPLAFVAYAPPRVVTWLGGAFAWGDWLVWLAPAVAGLALWGLGRKPCDAAARSVAGA